MSSIRSPFSAARGPGGLRSLKIALIAAVAALAAAGPAHANLTAFGPVDPATTFPHWYADPDGTQLELCVDQPNCLPGTVTPPDGEAFYYNAQADVDVDGGTAGLTIAVEAAFGGTDPITFGRVQVDVRGAAPNRTYTFLHPYGSGSLVTNASGVGRFRSQVGCAVPPAPCDFGTALGTEIGPYLRWDPTQGRAAPPLTLGDAVTPHAVTGSPIGRNSFSVTGVGTGSTNQFIVSGILASAPKPVINAPASVDFGSSPVGVPVDKTITVRSFGVPGPGSNLSISGPILGGDLPSQYSVVSSTCSGVFASGQSCSVIVRMVPTAAGPLPATLIIASNAQGGNGTVPLTGTGVAPGAGAAGATAASQLRISKLRTTHRMSRARVLSRGLRLSMRLPRNTEILKLSVLRVGRNGKVNRAPVWLGFRVVGRIGPSGLYRIRLDSRALRRRMKAGLYQLNVTPGLSKRELGRTSTTRIRITRR